jgi:hypothetical protein
VHADFLDAVCQSSTVRGLFALRAVGERMAAAHDDRSSIHPSRTLFGSPSSRARRLGTVGRGFAERVLRLVGHFWAGQRLEADRLDLQGLKVSLSGLTQKSPNRVARCRSCARELSLHRNEPEHPNASVYFGM